MTHIQQGKDMQIRYSVRGMQRGMVHYLIRTKGSSMLSCAQ